MSRLIDAIGRDKINRFTLAFQDAEMEKKFITEYTQNFIKISIVLCWIGLGGSLIWCICSPIVKDYMWLKIASILVGCYILYLLWFNFKPPTLRFLNIFFGLSSFLGMLIIGYFFFYILSPDYAKLN